MEQKKVLDQQIANTSAQIKNVETQIADYADLITQTEVELADAEKREEAQYELFCQRVRAMEESGEISYWSVLFGASSFTDMLTRLNDVNEVMDADQKVIDGLKALQVEITEKKEQLEDSKAEREAAKADLVSKKSELDKQRQQAISMVNAINDNEQENKETLAALDAEEDRILAEALRLSKKLAEEQAAQGKSPQSNPGGYIWPVDSRYITSTVGGRASIGNYLDISHGSGYTTLYGHMSSRKVEAGQYVNQGDVIGITGSTGHSTGPHLHFEITENGVRINPLNHGASPCKGYLTGYTLSGSA